MTKKPALALVGVGNPLMTDDAIGLIVARHIHERLPHADAADFIEASLGGLDLVESLEGYRRAIIIDAIKTDDGRAGDYYRLDIEDFQCAEAPAMTHHVGLAEGLELARRLGMDVPGTIHVFAIEAPDPYTFGEGLSEPLEAAVPDLVAAILEDLGSLS